MKTWFSGLTLIIQVLLVVAGVLVFAWFDPFDIFTNTKLSIRDTPSHVKQIKEIGELITAEYYGEVISSFYDVEKKEVAEKKDKIQSEVEAIDEAFTQGLKAIWEIDSEKEQLRQFNALCDNLENEQRFFDEYLDVLKSKFNLGLFNRKKTLLEKLSAYDMSEESIVKERISGVLNKKAIKDAEKKIEKEVDKRKQLILLARGKVQAGFKFNKLDNRNVRVDTIHHRIVIVGFNPEILSCTINPWFIPELGIKGFEIIDMSGRSDEVRIFNRVKASCKDSLKMKAIQSRILEKATKNAEKNLQAFFSILLNIKDINVTIVANELDFYATSLFDKKYMNLSELTLLDTLLGGYYLRNEDTTRIAKMLNTLTTKSLIVNTDTLKLSKAATCDSILNKYFINKKMIQHWQVTRRIVM